MRTRCSGSWKTRTERVLHKAPRCGGGGGVAYQWQGGFTLSAESMNCVLLGCFKDVRLIDLEGGGAHHSV